VTPKQEEFHKARMAARQVALSAVMSAAQGIADDFFSMPGSQGFGEDAACDALGKAGVPPHLVADFRLAVTSAIRAVYRKNAPE
jgi:hypothetical protein